VNVVELEAGGPYCCRGRIELRNADGVLLEAVSETWLCRCGQSQNKPYCDGSHARTGFQDSAFSVAAASAPGDSDALLSVRTRRDGPLKLEGPCEVRAPDGALLMRGEETALCRCGRSGKRPFCDGTHRSVGFSA
jgi:CDGSH-type Zn-finger protein